MEPHQQPEVAIAVDAAATALSALASSSCEPGAAEAIHAHSDVLVQQLAALNTRLQQQIETKEEPRTYSHQVHQARMRSQLVALRASLLGSHLDAMLEMDRK